MKKIVLLAIILLFGFYQNSKAIPSSCEDCHKKVTPQIVKDFNRSKMSKVLTCKVCHGEKHTNMNDAQKAKLPAISTCKQCHPQQANQYLSGKHALGLLAIIAFPEFAHKQPEAFIAGQKGCNGCHNLGIVDDKIRDSVKYRKYYKYGMDCQNCHTRHAFSVEEAKQPEACNSCHTGFDHAQWEMWFHSKHGSAYLTNRKAHRGPTCQDCHMPDGNHKVITAWGFLALRLPEPDKEWLNYRITILKALGVLNPDGKPTKRLELVKAANLARLDEKSWKEERAKMINICKKCHSESFARENLKNADLMIKAADKIFAEAINIVKDLYKDGIIPKKPDQVTWPYPDLLNFYEVDTPIEEMLYEMFMDYRMKTYQAAFHIMPDYTTWYGYAKMKETLVEIKKEAERMRREQNNI
ncbi:multiheme c-type cytochrome [Thermodesulfobacterium hydrogeniphilum]|uniref:multiheme c-type cytochrome n=1 Tax=Thermodesulfobacterium hydrogeniphilum TaxID=161156 RepID=UPI00056FC082|nr:multiheme c-type cytochrome [Thermodesulfobacterium hydrogeniphilum]